mgnify:FL=1
MLILFGDGTNRWTPKGVYLEAMFDVTMQPSGSKGVVDWVIKTRRGTGWSYRVNSPDGELLGKVAFLPKVLAAKSDGSHVIAKFFPEAGEPLPISVRLERGMGAAQTASATSSSRSAQHPPITMQAIVLIIVAGLVVLLFALARKGGTVSRVLAIVFGALLGVGVVTWLITVASYNRQNGAPAGAGEPVRSKFPLSAYLSKNGRSVVVMHDNVSAHYALFYDGKTAKAQSRNTQNRNSLLWFDDGTIELKNGRTFGYTRASTGMGKDLRINGREFDLRRGRVLVLRDDGEVEQLKMFPPLKIANDPDALAPLIAKVREMETEPVTPDKLRLQLRAAQEQLDELLKLWAPSDPLVTEARQSVETLREKIAATADATQAPAFGPIIERTLNDPNETLKDCLISLGSGTVRTLPDSFKGALEVGSPPDKALMDWLSLPDQTVDAAARVTLTDGKVTQFGLRTFHLLAVPIEADLADKLTPDQVLAKLREKSLAWGFIGQINDLMTDGKKPAAFVFQSRSGLNGILQILGPSDSPRGVKIRFKVVQEKSKATTPSTAQRNQSPLTSDILAADNSPEAIAKARQRGSAAATKDIQAGNLRILRYGLLTQTTGEERDEETGFRLQRVAGSILSSEFKAEADAYNVAMREHWQKHVRAERQPAAIPRKMDFKFLRAEAPKGSHRIELYFERDTNFGLGIEVTQNSMSGPNGEHIPVEFLLKYGRETKWVGVRQPSVLVWRLPEEFSEDEIQAGLKQLKQNASRLKELPEGTSPEFAHIKHREGWTYVLWSHVLPEPELRATAPPSSPAHQ